MICELSYRLDQFEKHTSGRKFVFFDKVLLLFHDMGLFLDVPGVRSYNLFSVLKRSPFLIILYNPFLAFREWERVSQKARHETSRNLQVEVSAAGFHISTPSHSASSLHRVRLCCVLSRMQMQQKMQPRLVLRQAVVRQPVVPSHARPAQPWLGQVHQLGQLNPARPMAMPVAMPTAMPTPIVKAGQARGEAIAMGLCGPAPKHPRTQHQSEGGPLWKVQDPGRFARARSGKRGYSSRSWNSSACPILPESQPWISSRKSGNMWRSLGTRLWHCFCQYSAHRAEPYALNINATIGWSRNFSTYFWPIFKASWSHAL